MTYDECKDIARTMTKDEFIKIFVDTREGKSDASLLFNKREKITCPDTFSINTNNINSICIKCNKDINYEGNCYDCWLEFIDDMYSEIEKESTIDLGKNWLTAVYDPEIIKKNLGDDIIHEATIDVYSASELLQDIQSHKLKGYEKIQYNKNGKTNITSIRNIIKNWNVNKLIKNQPYKLLKDKQQ